MKYILIAASALFITAGASAQDRVTGPKAKNTKAWEVEKETTLLSAEGKRQKGPEAKNYKPWRAEEVEKQEVNTKQSKRTMLKGPKAKNFKPWK